MPTWEDYLSNSGYLADNVARREFGQKLMLAFKIKNISEGVQWYQAIHMHARLRAWNVNMPQALGGTVETVDCLNMILAGDIETACLSAMYGTPDDMSSPLHWLSAERVNWLIGEMKTFLGWE